MSEIYRMPIEIYAYKINPMRTFHETLAQNNKKVIKITYHGKAHFNSLKEISSKDEGILQDSFGKVEEKALLNAKKLSDLRKMIQL